MDRIVNDETLDILFRSARSHYAWLDRPVSDTLLRALWELVRLAPTSDNCAPARLCFVKSQPAKDRLVQAIGEPDRPAAATAPVIVVIGCGLNFLDSISPSATRGAALHARIGGRENEIRSLALRDSALQAGYLLLAARALGLDCGLISQFDGDAVDRTIFADTAIRTNLLCGIGYGDGAPLRPRSARPGFDEACRIV